MEVFHRNLYCSCRAILTDFSFGRQVCRWYGSVPFSSGYFVVYGVLKIADDRHQYSQVGKFQIAFKIRDTVDLIDFILRMTFRSSGLYVFFLALFSHYPQKNVWQKYRIYLEFPKKRFSFVVTKQHQAVFVKYHEVIKQDQNERQDSIKDLFAYPRL